MALSELLVVSPVRQEGAPPLPHTVGVFTAPQTLLAFPVATSLVTTLARAARTIAGVDLNSPLMPLAAALTIGAAMFAITMSQPAARPRTLGGWLIAAVVTFLNCLVLFAAALGIEKL